MKILISTNNPHKLEELKKVINENKIDIELLALKDLDINIDPIENGKTLEDNSKIKAEEAYKYSKIPTLADDTGLFVNSLNGKPGIYSARYAGTNATDKENRTKLLSELKDYQDRSAYFKTVIYFTDGLNNFTFDGVCKGIITRSEKGHNGFGYDPIFKPEGYRETFAQLTAEIKNQISHRALATNKFVSFLKENLS